MEDMDIVALYWDRNESAISETADKYGAWLHTISFQIVADREDADECVSDTYFDAWQVMPPHRPSHLSTFLGKITRRISIDRWRRNNAQKRGKGEITLVLSELSECVSGKESVEDAAAGHELMERINGFLAELSDKERQVFVRRYWYMESVSTIAGTYGFSESKVKSMLMRTRNKLKTMLTEEGFV